MLCVAPILRCIARLVPVIHSAVRAFMEFTARHVMAPMAAAAEPALLLMALISDS
jgi:hypothetical protein